MTKLTPTGRISKSIRANHSKEYFAWMNIKARCYNERHKDYKNYGARGIKMNGGWNLSFNAFLQDVGKAPSKEYTIERINNDKNYEPGNVKWATRIEQASNKRNTILITYLGKTKMLGEWCVILGLRYGSLYKAIRANKDEDPSCTFFEFIVSKFARKYRSARYVNVKNSKRKYYHDLQSILIKYGLPLV